MKLVLGSANFNSKYGVNNKKIKKDELSKIIKYCNQNKINYLDTAHSYRNFKLLKNQNIKKFKIITKLPNLNKFKKKNLKSEIIEHVNKLLKILKINQIYGLLLHDVKPMYSKKSNLIIEAFKYLKKYKMVKKIGISCYHLDDLKLIKKKSIDIVQFPLNIFDQRLIKSKTLASLKKQKIEIHIRSIFLQGLLLEKSKKIDAYFDKWKNEFNNLENISKKLKKSKFELCINFIKQQKLVDMVVIGVDTKIQVDSIKKQFKKKFFKFNYEPFSQFDKKLILPYLWKLKKKNEI